MSDNYDCLKINEPNIVHENIDGETVILNLDSGNYYSIVDVGADIWDYIVKGAPIIELLPMIRENYECSGGEDDENAVNSFLKQLQQEGLVIAIDDKLTASLLPHSLKDKITTKKNKTVFNAPVLNKYTDIQDLLIVDPIHEVDATGWPSTKPSK